jgi:hypothetical protein
MSSSAWLRILVGLEWAAFVAAALVGFVFADSLPDPLRSYAPDLGSLRNEFAVGIGALVALLLHVAGSIAILAGWARARALYTAGTAALVAWLPFGGARVVHGLAEPFYEIASMATGAVLALLYLSPASLPVSRAPEGAAPARALRTAGLLLVGALAGIGVLALLVSFLAYGLMSEFDHAEDEARRIGTSTDDAGCLAAARERIDVSWGWFETGFLDTCLQHAGKTDAFCRDVPAIEPEADWQETAWAKARCQDDPRFDSCVALEYAVQLHCGERAGAP